MLQWEELESKASGRPYPPSFRSCLQFSIALWTMIKSDHSQVSGGHHMKATKARLTVDLPGELVKLADAAIERGAARSRNQLITQAIDAYLHSLEEVEIDTRFKAMAEDEAYQKLALRMTQELEHSDWEALQLGEGQES